MIFLATGSGKDGDVEKRVLLFFVLTATVIFAHLLLVRMVGPQRRGAPGAQAPQAPKAPPHDSAAEPDSGAKGLADKAPPAASPLAAERRPPRQPPESKPAAPQQWISLGSYAGTPHALLVTLNNCGAAVERIEITERNRSGKLRYRNLEERGGYLGSLALTVEPAGGCRVNVVGDGTPAALAKPSNPQWTSGLQVGDVLTKVDGKPLRDPADLRAWLREKKVGDTVRLTARRDVGGKAVTTDLMVRLDEKPLELIGPEPLEAGETAPQPLSLLCSLDQVGKAQPDPGSDELPGLPSLRRSTWDVKFLPGPAAGVEFRFVIDAADLQPLGVQGPLEIIKRYRLGAATDIQTPPQKSPVHHLKVELEVINRGQSPIPVACRLDGPNGLPLEGWWYLTKIHPEWFRSAGARDVVFRTAGDVFRLVGCSDICAHAQKNPKAPAKPLFAEGDSRDLRTLRYAGVDTPYFVAAVIPWSKGGDGSRVFRRAAAMPLGDLAAKDKARLRTANVSFQLITPAVTLGPGESEQRDFLLFAGPKEKNLLAAYELSDCLYYGWFWWVARPCSWLLNSFYRIAGNYGLAIIMLTVLVRGAMFPISRKAAQNAAMMQELAPEMRMIAEKYKNDMEKRARAQQELFRKHNYNPFSGCWLMFLQLPVFIGLYRALAVDINLRQAPLIPGVEWCSNLAGPDKLLNWEAYLPSVLGSETGWLGPYLNVLPLVTIALFIVHQKLFTPPATDEQTRMQMKMMQFMTVFIGVLFFKVASGLCVYFIASSFWSIAERKLLPKQKKPGEAREVKQKSPALSWLALPKGGSNGPLSKPAAKKRQRRR